MDCPTCHNAMITFELADVEIDHCVSCGGIWLDAGELDLLLDDPAKTRRLLDSFQEDASSPEKRLKCPICNKKMQKVVTEGSDPPLLIDKCPRADGLWFNRGELQDILSRSRLDGSNKVQGLLVDMFGQKRPS